ncbi:DNA translocase FtsK [Macrococcus bovicus]|uniref:DNA translocase FtsK n=1 Tax=Macrococcus bovicus TaxID=69968 RepID=A0A4R6C3P9_9STAP|nr:DNA translocase FtsK [Macrococcus bovicus]TDM15823.1 DNA translocase FtsK [Macrococcus bovicus]
MSWFDKLFGQDEKEQQPVETDVDQHQDIYRRPRGKFRFPIDLGDDRKEPVLTEQPEVQDNGRMSQQFVDDEYFERRRARRQKQEQPEKPRPQRTKEYQPQRIPDKKRQFTASEVPSAIFGTRKNLKPSEEKVVITPLTGKKPEKVKPDIPTYRQKDNVVNVENIYASQIVAEIRKEREKKMQARKAFEEARRQQKEQEKLVEILTAELEVETIELQEESFKSLEVEEISAPLTEDAPIETITVSSDSSEDHLIEPAVTEVDSSRAQNDAVIEKMVFEVGRNPETEQAEREIEAVTEAVEVVEEKPVEAVETEPEVIETEIMAGQAESAEPLSELSTESEPQPEVIKEPEIEEAVFTETVKSSETSEPAPQPKRKTSPFNVLMTPSDKKRLMNKASATSVTKETAPASSAEEKKAETEKTKRIGPKYLLPPVSLLSPEEKSHENVEWVEEQRQQLDEAFYHFNVPAKVEEVVIGPSVTRYELSVEKGVKVSRITNLQDDIKMALAAKEIRIEAPIPGTSRVGVEVPNIDTRKVNLSEVIFSKRFKFAESKLMVALGAKINNEPMLMDIAKMPHALIAGATGSGKSVSINAILLSLLYRNNPNELKLLLIDPKMVELAPYNELPHLIAPVITDVKAATESLKWVVEEMERRYKVFSDVHVRNITAYNQKSPYDKRMPKIVVVIDELADLMMMAPQDVEHSIARIAQKARAAGIHMILATQRPSVNVITGLIKANVPTRIAFMVSSSIDSRTILDNGGAEKLLGNGDMLYQGNGMNKPIRIQGCYVSDEEIDAVVDYIKAQGEPQYLFQEKELLEKGNEVPQDELFDEVVQFMLEEGHISTSQLQRRFQIGYNRAARIIDSLESMGYISGANGSKPRTVLVSENQL